MRKLLMVASAAAMALTAPALAQGKGGGGNGHGGGKPEKAEKGHGGGGHGSGRGGGDGGFRADKPHKADRGWAKQEFKADKSFRKQEMKADRGWAKSEAKAEKKFRKNEDKAEKRFAKQQGKFRKEEQRFRSEERRVRNEDIRFSDRNLERDFREDERRFAGGEGCPPGLAKKGNGCMPPGQAKKSFAMGERLPSDYFDDYALPARYQEWYPELGGQNFRYDQGNILGIGSGGNIVSALIPLLGGGLGVGSLLPAGYDVYNLPMQYRDDYVDSSNVQYRYGDDAIFQVDPKTQMIQSVVELLAGDLNVGQLLPAGYDTYNLPMEYRDQYVDSDESMYRYADGNIYEVDPQTQMIEQIVAMIA